MKLSTKFTWTNSLGLGPHSTLRIPLSPAGVRSWTRQEWIPLETNLFCLTMMKRMMKKRMMKVT